MRGLVTEQVLPASLSGTYNETTVLSGDWPYYTNLADIDQSPALTMYLFYISDTLLRPFDTRVTERRWTKIEARFALFDLL